MPSVRIEHHGLHEGHALANDPAVIVKRLDDGVAAAAARLGGEPRREDAREEGPHGRKDEQQPGPKYGSGRRLAEDPFAGRSKRQVSRHRLEADALNPLDAREEERAQEPGRRADERRVQEHAPQDLELDRRRRGGSEETLQRAQPAPRGAV